MGFAVLFLARPYGGDFFRCLVLLCPFLILLKYYSLTDQIFASVHNSC